MSLGTCPRCGSSALEQDTVDVGVGEMPCGPLGCTDCGWYEHSARKRVVIEHLHGASTELNEPITAIVTHDSLIGHNTCIAFFGTRKTHWFDYDHDVKSVSVTPWMADDENLADIL